MGYTQEKKTNILHCQEKKTNILHCDGCALHCAISAQDVSKPYEDMTDDGIRIIGNNAVFVPKINNTTITEYTDRNNIHHSYTECTSPAEAYELLRKEILPACDNYKHRNQR